jgi:SAF domain
MSIDVKAGTPTRAPAAAISKSSPASGSATSTPDPPRIPGRRNPKWIALGIVALCLGALLSYAVYNRVAAETTVIMMAATVYRGETVEASDLAVVQLSGEAVRKSIPAAQLDALVGQKAVYDLPAGTMPVPGAIDEVVIPDSGRAVVGVMLSTGRAPAALLTPGSPARLVVLPPASTTDPDTTDKLAGKTYPATIVDQVPGADGASIVINVDVASGQAATIAMLAASDRIAVVRDPAR